MANLAQPNPPNNATAIESYTGAVVIGRNEGERLRACLQSILSQLRHIVYVDSGSTDGSVDMAKAMGVEVVDLDVSIPFTAARARNSGLARLRALHPHLSMVQMVDGDCEVRQGWLRRAAAWLDAHPDVAVVCGRRRERYPQATIYNLLCDIEWDTPVGEARACGGDALFRAAALTEAGGYRDDLIAGEEPELCLRLRAKGWRVWRIDAEMTLHDAALTRFGQWWRRTTRAGFAYAQGSSLHGAPPERHWVRESRSAWLWGAILPLAILSAAVLLSQWFLLGFAAYPIQVARLYRRVPGAPRERILRSLFLVISKISEYEGQIQFMLRSITRGPARLIEYK
jgi:glycosyltransferase involved in cell wall biosynthesis